MTSCWRKTLKSKLFRARIAVFKLRPVLVSSYSLFVLRFFPYCPGVYSQGQQISGLMGYSYFSRIQVRTYIASFAGREESEAQSETQTERYLCYGANLVSGIWPLRRRWCVSSEDKICLNKKNRLQCLLSKVCCLLLHVLCFWLILLLLYGFCLCMFLVSTTWIDFQGSAFLVVLVALTLHLLCFVWFFAFVVSFFCFLQFVNYKNT